MKSVLSVEIRDVALRWNSVFLIKDLRWLVGIMGNPRNGFLRWISNRVRMTIWILISIIVRW